MRVRCDWARGAGMTPAVVHVASAVYAADAYAVDAAASVYAAAHAAVEESPQ